ncbi:MAG: rhodanese-like domain-containing protein [Candidatus Brocadiia bacterium]
MKAKLFLISLLAVANLFGCNDKTEPASQAGGPKAQYHKISADEAKKQLDADNRIILVDVRTEAEYKDKHIPGSILLPVDRIAELAPAKLPDKEAKIFVYCRSGNRSEAASQKLIELGYKNVYDFGGIIDWKYQTESDN